MLDAVKGIACFMVVLLHFPTKGLGDGFYSFQTVIGRCGVPMFFMVSGFLASKVSAQKRSEWFLKQAKKVFLYFLVFWAVLAVWNTAREFILRGRPLPLDISAWNIVKVVVFAELPVAGYLWYFIAYAECLLLYWAFSHSRNGYKILGVLSPLLFVCYELFGRYSGAIFGKPIEQFWARNFLIAAVPMFAAGFFLDKIKLPVKTGGSAIAVCVVLTFALMGEAGACSEFPMYDMAKNNYFFNFALAFMIMYYAVNFGEYLSGDNLLAVIGRKYSLYIYVFQYAAKDILDIAKYVFMKHYATQVLARVIDYARPVWVFAAALLLSAAVVKAQKKISEKKTANAAE